MCIWGLEEVATWGGSVANAWRISGDMQVRRRRWRRHHLITSSSYLASSQRIIAPSHHRIISSSHHAGPLGLGDADMGQLQAVGELLRWDPTLI
jgi:hypothetical protein